MALAFIFACDEHIDNLGAWATRRWGGCYVGPAATAPETMKYVSTEVAEVVRARIPHGKEFNSLVRIPGFPKPP
jgi:hypothetical protein